MKILIVDDERMAIKSIKRVLRRVVPQAELFEAENGEKALLLCRKMAIDVVLLDIQMPDRDGLSLAQEMTAILPNINIIMTTAYPQYALDAFKVYASGYLLKPVLAEDLKDALFTLRYPVKEKRKGLYVQCFGHFEVFFDGSGVHFGRAKTKELFAYLIDRRGASVTNSMIRTVLWGDEVSNDEKQLHYFAQIVYELGKKLEELGCADIFRHTRNAYAIVPEKIPCDYYAALQNDMDLKRYTGEYMAQYEWADLYKGDYNEY